MYSPRIYLYKITFEEVPYYYYGVHKEKKFNEYYMGSPITHRWIWDFYTPKKQILEVFEYSDCGWSIAQEVEKRLIKPVYNTDKWCLNEHCGGYISLDILRKVGKDNKELKRGYFSLSPEQRKENNRKNGKLAALSNKQNKKSIFSFTKEQLRENGRKGGKKIKELGVGLFGINQEERSKNAKLGGKISSMQKWECLETGFVTNAGNLTKYQNARKIDTTKRRRVA